jgi:heme-degrading monooxygenase HmoA
MSHSSFHLAQLNIGRMLGPIDSPIMAEFVAQLDEVNALAERSPGFVWRLVGAGNDATSLRPFPDDLVIVNMSVWESLDALKDYVYRSDHARVFKDRRKWFAKMAEAYMVLWWVPAGNIPTVDEAKGRLMHLREHGETPYAFTFRNVHPPEILTLC